MKFTAQHSIKMTKHY